MVKNRESAVSRLARKTPHLCKCRRLVSTRKVKNPAHGIQNWRRPTFPTFGRIDGINVRLPIHRLTRGRRQPNRPTRRRGGPLSSALLLLRPPTRIDHSSHKTDDDQKLHRNPPGQSAPPPKGKRGRRANLAHGSDAGRALTASQQGQHGTAGPRPENGHKARAGKSQHTPLQQERAPAAHQPKPPEPHPPLPTRGRAAGLTPARTSPDHVPRKRAKQSRHAVNGAPRLPRMVAIPSGRAASIAT